jgi:hypothetical protein
MARIFLIQTLADWNRQKSGLARLDRYHAVKTSRAG